MYDFDWDGETIVLGDDEGQSLTLPEEPTHNQQGVSAPGSLDAFTDFSNFGVFNGNFRKGPPDPTANLDVASSTSGSNFMPGWRFIQSSNTNVTAKQIRDAASPSGSNLRFAFASGAATDAAYVEQTIDIGGGRYRHVGDLIRAVGVLVTGANVAIRVYCQYLSTDGSIAGMPAEKIVATVGTSGSASTDYSVAAATVPPSNARYLRVRAEASRISGTAAASVDLIEVRRDRGYPFHVIDDLEAGFVPGIIYQTQGRPEVTVPAESNIGMPLGYQLVPLTFVQNDVPAATTAVMPLSDLTMPGFMGMPWGGSIVGMSYRFDNATPLTAGTASLKAQVNGANVWTAHSLTTSSAQNDEATQAIGTDTFVAGDTVGVELSTGGAYAPTTRELAVTLWLAISYDGA